MFLLVGCAANTVLKGSVLLTTAPQQLPAEVCVSNMAVAARKYARWKAAALLHMHVVYVLSMEHVSSARLLVALPTHNSDLNIVANTKVE